MRIRGIVVALLAASALAPGTVAHALAAPMLSGSISSDGILTDELWDEAHLADGDAATGWITFTLYGPDDATCSLAPVGISYQEVGGNGFYRSATYHPSQAGTYRFVAAYGGDAQNAAVATVCGDPSQQVAVDRAPSRLETTASAPAATTGELDDVARLTGVAGPTGTITFTLYGPDDPLCARAPAFIGTSEIVASGSFSSDARVASPPYVPTAPGVYRWVAAYAGDARNTPAAGRCGDDGESVTVTAPPPRVASLTVRASPPAHVGDRIGATASLSAPGIPFGTLTFRVYGPGDDDCRVAVAASTRTALGNGDYASEPFEPDAPGTYRFVVDYLGGDGLPAATRCDDPSAQVAVTPVERPKPVLDESVTVEWVGGDVFVQVPGRPAGRTAAASAIGFVALRDERVVPVGTTVDTRTGTVRVTSATSGAALQSGVFHGSRFVVRQRHADHGLVRLQLRTAANARAACGEAAPTRAKAAKRRKLDEDVLAKLRSRVRGRFETEGKHSSASAHGTEWLMVERCDGTLTRVFSGVVTVRDFRLRRTVTLRVGRSYLAKAGTG